MSDAQLIAQLTNRISELEVKINELESKLAKYKALAQYRQQQLEETDSE